MLSDFTTTCPACDRTCPVSVDHLRAWTSDDDQLEAGEEGRSTTKAMPVTCAGCATTFWVEVVVETASAVGQEPVAEQLPPLPDGAIVRVRNRQHPLDGLTGWIRGRKHWHYRVELDVGTLWLPATWIELAVKAYESSDEGDSEEA